MFICIDILKFTDLGGKNNLIKQCHQRPVLQVREDYWRHCLGIIAFDISLNQSYNTILKLSMAENSIIKCLVSLRFDESMLFDLRKHTFTVRSNG